MVSFIGVGGLEASGLALPQVTRMRHRFCYFEIEYQHGLGNVNNKRGSANTDSDRSRACAHAISHQRRNDSS